HYLLREFMREIPEALPRKDTALDVGCGPGYYLLHLVKDKKYQVIGLDPILDSSLQIPKNTARA
ncbi:MAG: DUF1698 domain-containing protein, partial [Candidatus Baldrarchaeia archaeon]